MVGKMRCKPKVLQKEKEKKKTPISDGNLILQKMLSRRIIVEFLNYRLKLFT